MKKFLLSIALLTGFSPKIFASDQHLIVVELHDQTEQNVALDPSTKITWKTNVMADSVAFQSLGEETTSVPLTKVKKITFIAPVVSGVTDVKASAAAPAFSLSGCTLIVTGIEPGSSVLVYSIDGRLCATAVGTEAGKATLTLPPLTSVFVVKTTSASFKIIKK